MRLAKNLAKNRNTQSAYAYGLNGFKIFMLLIPVLRVGGSSPFGRATEKKALEAFKIKAPRAFFFLLLSFRKRKLNTFLCDKMYFVGAKFGAKTQV